MSHEDVMHGDELILDSGLGYGGTQYYYNHNRGTFWAQDYRFHIDDGMDESAAYWLPAQTVVERIIHGVGTAEASFKALRRVAELVGPSVEIPSDEMRKLEVKALGDRWQKHWCKVGPRGSGEREHSFNSLTLHPIDEYDAGGYWLPDFGLLRLRENNYRQSLHSHPEYADYLELIEHYRSEKLREMEEYSQLVAGDSSHPYRYYPADGHVARVLRPMTDGPIELLVHYDDSCDFGFYELSLAGDAERSVRFGTDDEFLLREALGMGEMGDLDLAEAFARLLARRKRFLPNEDGAEWLFAKVEELLARVGE